jgi:two-component system CheB/CheR fusion protein
MINKQNHNLKQLRERAEFALKNGELAFQRLTDINDWEDARELVEEFRVYQAELEIQNEELNRSQLQAEQSLARYRLLFSTLPLAAVVLDRYGIIEDTNTQAIDLFGFSTSSKLLKHSIYRLIANEDKARILDVLHLENSGTTTILQDIKVRNRHNEWITMDGHLIHLPLDYHLDNYTLLLLVDRSIETCREQDRVLFQSMFDNSPSIMAAFDEQGRCILANSAMLKFINHPNEQILGRTRQFWQNSIDAQIFQNKDYAVFETGNPSLEEELCSDNNVGKHHYITNRFPLRNKSGDIFGVGLVKTDITAIREIEVRLQLAMQVFSQGSEGIIITDAKNKIISVNKAFERITGYCEKDVLGKNPSVLSSGKQDKNFYEQMWRDLICYNEWEGEIYNRRHNGEIYPQRLNISRVLDDQDNLTYYIAIFNDITHKKRIENEIHQLAFYDPLTGSPNRHLLHDRLNQAISLAHRENKQLGLIFLDLDRFKEVNDTLGHSAGDELLIEVAHRLKNCVRDEDTVCRFGGDEFILLLGNISDMEVIQKAQTILDEVLKRYVIQNEVLTLSASMGIAMYPRDGEDYATLLKNADAAMYDAKESGRNAFRFYQAQLDGSIMRRMAVENALHNAIENEELWLAFQPQICTTTKNLKGVEVLLRWNHEALNHPSPNEFIPIAEATGLIVPIGEWVLKESLKQAKLWLDAGLAPFTIAVNISARQFWNKNFSNFIHSSLFETGVPPHLLELELTERVVMREPEAIIEVMNELTKLGVQISIDDFGTGYSSLNYLKRLPVTKLKIDQSFVRDIESDNDDGIIVLSIIQLAKALGKQTIAEGVETLGQELFLFENGCDTIQGFLHARPMTITEFESWLSIITEKLTTNVI